MNLQIRDKGQEGELGVKEIVNKKCSKSTLYCTVYSLKCTAYSVHYALQYTVHNVECRV